MLTTIVVILFALILVIDLLPNFKKWVPRERFAYLATFSTAFVLLMLYTLDVKLPSLYEAFMSLFKEILPNI